MLTILAAAIVVSALSFVLIDKPIQADNFVGAVPLNSYPDGLDWLRRLLIYPGLVLFCFSFIIFLKSVLGKNAGVPDKILNYTVLLLTFCLGWVCIPYWANGLHHIFWSGTTSLYDPKSLLPYSDISVVWNSGVMLFYLLAFVLIIVPLIFAVIDIRKHGFGRKYLYAAAVYLLIFAAFQFAPNYLYWFLD